MRALSNKQGSDFKRNKLKLGTARGLKKKSATHTDLTLHTRVINLPTQSVATDKGTMVTHRHLELADLLCQLSHHNDNVRKDALLGLVEIFTLHPSLLSQHLSEVVEKSVEMIIDGAAIVRKAFVDLTEFLLNELEEKFMFPFLQLYVVYITSAMSHSHKDVSVDGVKVINLWMDHYPDSIVTKYKLIVPQYIRLFWETNPLAFHAQLQGKAGLQQNLKGKMEPQEKRLYILQSFEAYMKLVFASGKTDRALACAQVVSCVDSYDFVEGVPNNIFSIGRRHNVPKPYDVDNILDSRTLLVNTSAPETETKFESIVGKSLQNKGTKDIDLETREGVIYFAMHLCPLLFGTWVECFPNKEEQKFGNLENNASVAEKKKNSGLHLSMLFSVMSLANLVLDLVEDLVNDKPSKFKIFEAYLKEISKFVVQYFPFHDKIKRDGRASKINENELLAELDITACKVLMHFLPLAESSIPEAGSDSNSDSDVEMETPVGHFIWIDKLREYLATTLQNITPDPPTKKRGVATKKQKTQPVDTEEGKGVATELLPLVYKVLPYLKSNDQLQLIEVFSALYLNSDSKSETKLSCLKFLQSLFQDADLKALWEASTQSQSSDQKGAREEVETSALFDDSKKRKRVNEKDTANKKQKTSDDIFANEEKKVGVRKYKTLHRHFHTWLLSLPRYLWELRDSNPETTDMILKLLKYCLGHVPASLSAHTWRSLSPANNGSPSPLLDGIQAALVPFFHATFGEKQIFGPFLKQPAPIQRAAIEVLFFFRPLLPSLVKSLAFCLTSPQISTPVSSYALELLCFPASQHFPAMSQFFSFLLSLITGMTREDAVYEILDVLTKSLRGLNLETDQIWRILVPHLLPILTNLEKTPKVNQTKTNLLTFLSTYTQNVIRAKEACLEIDDSQKEEENNDLCLLPEEIFTILPHVIIDHVLDVISKKETDSSARVDITFDFAQDKSISGLLELYPGIVGRMFNILFDELPGASEV
eukprot:TRINITY_DN5526_c0_g2_i3.p1 TRINITY_DN5526_c0_g2~~TRINITY_DN5526_c0_g2_i3.p1  ORF type:complete len:990 (-),score=218.09 TRINITY_DN5526_c0_g2_i3:258-3227(-)